MGQGSNHDNTMHDDTTRHVTGVSVHDSMHLNLACLACQSPAVITFGEAVQSGEQTEWTPIYIPLSVMDGTWGPEGCALNPATVRNTQHCWVNAMAFWFDKRAV